MLRRPVQTLAARSLLAAQRTTLLVAMPNKNAAVLGRFTLARGMASSRDNFIKTLGQEIKHEAEEVEKAKALGKQPSPFKLVSEAKNGDIVLARETDGYKIKVLFNAKELVYDYPEDEAPISTLPIQIEITPAGSELSILVSGEVEEQTLEEGEQDQEDVTPFFTPTSVKTGKTGAITDQDFSPDIDELDEDLQDCFAEWLSDFEIDQDLFQLVLDHAERKENQMYLEWLTDLKKVVEGGK